jgi:hypothetical protein
VLRHSNKPFINGYEALYNVCNDPSEWDSLAGDKAVEPAKQRLQALASRTFAPRRLAASKLKIKRMANSSGRFRKETGGPNRMTRLRDLIIQAIYVSALLWRNLVWFKPR